MDAAHDPEVRVSSTIPDSTGGRERLWGLQEAGSGGKSWGRWKHDFEANSGTQPLPLFLFSLPVCGGFALPRTTKRYCAA